MSIRHLALQILLAVALCGVASAETIATLRWDVGDKAPYSVVVERVFEDGIAGRRITIKDQERELLHFSDMDGFLGMFQTSDSGGLLVTYWIGGSSYHIRVYAKTQKGVRNVLEDGSKRLPEIIYEDGKPLVLVSDVTGGDKIMRAYKWTGTEFSPKASVDRKKFLDSLK